MAEPLYRQIAKALRHRIEAGEWAPEAQLPTEDVLMVEYHTSRNTVRAAIKELATRGMVETHHGRGTFVVQATRPIVTTLTTDPKTGSGGGEGLVYTAEVAAKGRMAKSHHFRLGIEEAGPDVASLLRIPAGAEVISRSELRSVDDLPWSLQTSFYPRVLADRAPRLLEGRELQEGTVAYLADCGIHQQGYQDSIEVRPPNEEEAMYFELPSDGRVQVVEISRVAFDQEMNPFRLTVTIYRADRNRFIINVGMDQGPDA